MSKIKDSSKAGDIAYAEEKKEKHGNTKINNKTSLIIVTSRPTNIVNECSLVCKFYGFTSYIEK
ncbi:MAG TPA: hypothetical protein VFT71_06955 [Candidatus Nitrosocosmicus sp.]|nr:hypothetical protein [Candidatus Nitrosocosmicus sp.]